MFAEVTGADGTHRELAVRALAAMGEMGLLMSARDSNGPGAEDARHILMELNRPAEHQGQGQAAH
jgi:hypothetical protein